MGEGIIISMFLFSLLGWLIYGPIPHVSKKLREVFNSVVLNFGCQNIQLNSKYMSLMLASDFCLYLQNFRSLLQSS